MPTVVRFFVLGSEKESFEEALTKIEKHKLLTGSGDIIEEIYTRYVIAFDKNRSIFQLGQLLPNLTAKHKKEDL